MYICLCNSVTDNDIRHCVEGGARSMRQLRLELGVASQCGKCACSAREILEECKGGTCPQAMMGTACPV